MLLSNDSTKTNGNMRLSKSSVIIIAIGVFAIGVLFFIHFSNDHIECKNVIESSIGLNGEKVITETHMCKERFSF